MQASEICTMGVARLGAEEHNHILIHTRSTLFNLHLAILPAFKSLLGIGELLGRSRPISDSSLDNLHHSLAETKKAPK